jgi:hypothetical protein
LQRYLNLPPSAFSQPLPLIPVKARHAPFGPVQEVGYFLDTPGMFDNPAYFLIV